MSKRIEIVSSFYDDIDEDSRLNSSRHGQVGVCYYNGIYSSLYSAGNESIKDNAQVYEERQPNGQWLKSMDSNFRLSRKI